MVDLLLADDVRSLPHRFCDDILDPITDLAPVQATDGGLVIDRLLEGYSNALIALAPVVSVAPLLETVVMQDLQVARVTAIPWLSLLPQE